MDILQKAFNDALESALSELEEPIDDEKLEHVVNDVIALSLPEITSDILTTLKNSAPLMLKERRELSDDFVHRNYNRWSKGFDLLEMLIVMCTEAGENFNNHYRPHAVEIQDVVFDTVVRMHARACHISAEILCLLKNGYADGAHARWRALHEVVSTAYFIHKHGKEAAIRFLDHEIIESYKGMIQYNKYEGRLNVEPFSQTEVDDCKAIYDVVLEKYGKEFKESYGWASPYLDNKRPNFSHIEADVDLDHMRPYYKWASHNIHANAKGITNKLGLCESKEDILLVGQSNSGMTDPAHATAIALSQITTTLINIEPSIDTIVTSKMIAAISDEVGDAFIQVEREI
jgi:hypothetical protein